MALRRSSLMASLAGSRAVTVLRRDLVTQRPSKATMLASLGRLPTATTTSSNSSNSSSNGSGSSSSSSSESNLKAVSRRSFHASGKREILRSTAESGSNDSGNKNNSNDNNKTSPSKYYGSLNVVNRREFHASSRKEMLPVIGGAIAIAAVATGLRYLIRAGKRMSDLEQAEKKKGGSDGSGGGKNAPPSDGPAFGLDVGVTNLRLAFADSLEKRPEVIENLEGSRFTPSCVSFKGGAEPVVGSLARAQRFESAATTLVGMQPLLGLPFSDPSVADIITASGGSLFGRGSVEEGEGGLAGIRIGEGGKVLTSEEALGLMLGNMRSLGEDKVKAGGSAVLSCPAYWGDVQREAMVKAGESAGIHVLDTIEDSVAAVLAAEELSIISGKSGGGLIAVLDIGGRSAQCSIVDARVKGDRPKLVGSDWTVETGGDQWDAGIVEVLDEEFQKANGGLSLMGDAMAITRLFDAATAARVELTRVQQAHVNIPYITADQTGPKHLDVTLTRARVDRIIEPLLRKAEAPCSSALSMAQVDASALSAVLVVGGCSRTPALQDLAAKIFGKAGGGGGDGLIFSPEESEELTVLGAAYEARHIIYEE